MKRIGFSALLLCLFATTALAADAYSTANWNGEWKLTYLNKKGEELRGDVGLARFQA